jgi:Tfp pilus assembly protein FimV
VASWGAAAPTAAGGVRVVSRGESLWSIATELAGPGASARRIASVTGDLWTLNAAVIGSGSPHTLFVGARLRLPEIR